MASLLILFEKKKLDEKKMKHFQICTGSVIVERNVYLALFALYIIHSVVYILYPLTFVM